MDDGKPCGAHVYWWEGEYDNECSLPEDHDGPHFDGLSFFNDDNEEVDDPPNAEQLRDQYDPWRRRSADLSRPAEPVGEDPECE